MTTPTDQRGPDWTPTDEARFWKRVQKGDGCWLWMGAKVWDGYGQIRLGGFSLRAHRIAYMIGTGGAPIPAGMVVCHHCDNPACVRFDHLFLGTVADNNRDRDQKGRGSRWRAELTHCKRGHEFTSENVYLVRSRKGARPFRMCKECANWLRREHRAAAARAVLARVPATTGDAS